MKKNVNKPHNILVIMTDQHNVHALGCYGNEQVKTPNIDKLAKEGVLFKNTFCQSAQCRPSRFSIWTGEYARSHGLYWNTDVEQTQENLISKIYNNAGYMTATIGKHHMNMNQNDNHGFQEVSSYMGLEYSKQGRFLPLSNVHPGGEAVGQSDFPNESHSAGIITQYTLDFLKKHTNKPFLLFHSFYGPHTPICPSLPWAKEYNPNQLKLPPNNLYSIDENIPNLEKFKSKSGNITTELHHEILAYYYAMVSQIDYNIGLIIDELDRLELLENTIIVFTSDHGEMMSEHGIWTKGKLGYDATIRVPLIVKIPNNSIRDFQSEELIGSIDLLPTLLSLSNIHIPSNVQGKSFEPLLSNKPYSKREYIITETGPNINNACISVRSKLQKYVQFREEGRVIYEQFFNLKRDPWEMKNELINSKYLNTIDGFKAYLNNWEKQMKIHKSLINN